MSFKRWRRRVSDPLGGLAAHLALFAVGCGSFGALKRIARLLSPLVRTVRPSARKLVLANLRTAFPDWPADRLEQTCRQSVENAILTALEVLWMLKRPEELAENVDTECEGGQELITAGQSGRGFIMLTPHLGNWEMAGQAVADKGVELYAVAHRIRNPWLDRIMARARASHGMQVIWEHGAARGIIKVLRAGKPVAVLMDQNTRVHEGGIFADFFGLPVSVTRGPAALARKLDVDVLFGACVRGEGRPRMVTDRLPKPVSEYASDAELTQAMLNVNERYIRRFPEQYVWLYRRWRYIPTTAPPEIRERYPYYARLYDELPGGG